MFNHKTRITVMKQNVLFTILSIAFVFKSLGEIRFVTPLGAGALDGTSWANAFPGSSLQAAID